MKELKPCPFCGGPAAVIRQTYIHGTGDNNTILEYFKYRPMCLRCFARIPEDRYETVEDAFNAWNRRYNE